MWEIKVTTFRVEVAQKKDNESVNSADNSTRKYVQLAVKDHLFPETNANNRYITF
jgi:hypothetical protein